jgi:putative endopeptidase
MRQYVNNKILFTMKQIIIPSLSALLTAFFLSGCNQTSYQCENDPLVINRDTTVKPGDNFFLYANGTWFKNNPIPSTESSNGIFKLIKDTIDDQVKHICERSAKDSLATKGSNKQKIGDFFASGMDSVAIDKAGIEPLNDEIQMIDAVSDIPSLLTEIAHLHSIGVAAAYNAVVAQDDRLSNKYALFFWQGGLGLGDREYYFNTDERTSNIRKEYVKHIATMFKLTGKSEAEGDKIATVIMKLETDLAASCRKMEELRDPVKNYNKMTLHQFTDMNPSLAWESVIPLMGISGVDTVILGQPEFYTSLEELVKKYPIDDWKNYLRWNLINTYSEFLSRDIEAEDFHFYSTILRGVKDQRPRWKRVVDKTNGYLGELIGKVYIDEYLPAGTKEKLLEVGNSIRDVYAEHIKNLDWMGDSTKVKALDKLSKIVMKVGYPDKWKDMSALEIDRSTYCDNAMRCMKWYGNYFMSRYGKPVDRLEWHMYPQTYNAYYNPSNNEIVMPACIIMVPGFEGRMPDDAVIYGIIGAGFFGHEITHGFDDQGCQYDANGNLNNWWTEKDRDLFNAKTKLIVEQFSNYTVLDSMHLNGDASQGENIADLGGIVIGYEAFKKTSDYKKHNMICGMTPDQRFFLAYAYGWMHQTTDESLANQIMTDVHAPAEFRVNGPLSDVPEFYTAFDIKPGDKFYRPDSLRVAIW